MRHPPQLMVGGGQTAAASLAFRAFQLTPHLVVRDFRGVELAGKVGHGHEDAFRGRGRPVAP